MWVLAREIAGFVACAALCACAGQSSDAEPPAPSMPTSAAGTDGSSAAGPGAAASDGNAGDQANTGAAGRGASSSAGSAASAVPTAGSSGHSSGGVGAGGSHGGATLPPNTGLPPPDPNVTFEWPATLPGDDDCRPGTYTGTFSCEYRLAPTDVDPLVVVDGPISLTLERSQDGEFLEITDGQLEGIAQLVIGFRSQLAGKLDCATGVLTANAVDGLYGFGDPAALPFGGFEGTLDGTLDTSSGTLDGTWDLSVSMGGACVGPWQANWTP